MNFYQLLFANLVTVMGANIQQPDSSLDVPIKMGSDAPASHETISYLNSHIAINVQNITASLDFYQNVFGFRIVFYVQASSKISLHYLAHAHGGYNGTGYQTASEMYRENTNTKGQLEMLYANVTVPLPSPKERTRLAHIGMIVPDADAFQKRLDRQFPQVPILKRIEEPISFTGVLGNALGVGDEVIATLDEADRNALQKYGRYQASKLLFLLDPDGNVVEVEGAW